MEASRVCYALCLTYSSPDSGTHAGLQSFGCMDYASYRTLDLASVQACKCVRVEPEIFRLNGVCRLIYYYCDCSSDCGGVVAMEFS
eukprot:jgi/Chrzof1/12842/Cz07g09100.t1